MPTDPALKNSALSNSEIYTLEYAQLDFRAHPERYIVGKGEQGVLTVQPYKSAILPHWRFATPELARISSEYIYTMFLEYKVQGDFVGMDMARKFLMMGWTRSRRYANHKGGKKYDGPVPLERRGQSGAWGRDTLPLETDPVKAESAAIFYARYMDAKNDPDYLRMLSEHLEKHEGRVPKEPKEKAPRKKSSTRRAA